MPTEKENPYQILSSYEKMEQIKELRKTKPKLKLYSRISRLDQMIDGFVPGELVVISGPTKHGKTTFGQTLTCRFIDQNQFPLWFSFEMMDEQFFEVFGEQLPLFYMPERMKYCDVKWVINTMVRAQREHAVNVVFIDHLHYLFNLAASRNTSIDIGNVIRNLKLAAVQYGMIVFLFAHTKKMGPRDDLTYNAIRDSSLISQESDTVLMIRRDIESRSSKAKLSVEFSRRTGRLSEMVDLVLVKKRFEQREIF